MKNFLRYSFVALMAMIMGNAFAQEVVFDFTDEANPWGFPTEQLKETGTFTKDGKSIVITTTNYTRWFSDSKALLIGKEGATLTLPAFDFDVEKIEVVGHDGASGKVTHNIFVGDEAVSTEVTGAKGTSSFEIAAGKQAAGTIYVLKVTNANNDQICKINIWKKGTSESGSDTPGSDSQTSDEVKTVTIAEFNAAAESNDVWYQLTGTVKNLKDGDQYGNFDLEDETGSVYVYGVLSEKGGEKKKFQELVAAKGIKNGDKLTIIGNRGSYTNKTTGETKIEVMNAYFVSVEAGSEDPNPQGQETVTIATCAEVLAGTDGTVYRVTGKCVEIANTTYGNWYLEDATGKIYIYGTLDKEGNAGKNNSIDVWGIGVGDELTVEGERTTYNETVELKNVKVITINKNGNSPVYLCRYSWEGGADGATESGGKATYENGETDETKYRVNYKNGDYYTICINGKKANIDDAAGTANGGYILITLDQELQAGNRIELTGYINKNESKEASIYFQFEKGDGINDDYIFDDANNIDAAIGGKIISHVFQVPASAAGSKSFKMSRNKAGTNIFLTKLAIWEVITGIKEIKTVLPQSNAIYNLAGQKVGNDYKGIVIVNGKKFVQK